MYSIYIDIHIYIYPENGAQLIDQVIYIYIYIYALKMARSSWIRFSSLTPSTLNLLP